MMKNSDCKKVKGNYRKFDKKVKKCFNKNASMASSIFPEMICGEPKKPSNGDPTSTCQGDSGGPYTVKNMKHQHFLVGVTSHAFGCAEVIVKTQLTQTQPIYVVFDIISA